MFWLNVNKWLKNTFPSLPSQTLYYITFGLILKNKEDELYVHAVLCLAKFLMHKNRIQKCHPNFVSFRNEFSVYLQSLKFVNGSKAQNIYDIMSKFRND